MSKWVDKCSHGHLVIKSAGLCSTIEKNDRKLKAFVDGVVQTACQNNIVGATVAITQKDQVILLKGYGFADKEN